MLKRVYACPTGDAAIFLDRDGVINERIPGSYVMQWNDFVFIDEALSSMREAQGHMPLVIVSNQRCIGLELTDAGTIAAIMHRMVEELSARGISIAAWYVCPHDYGDACACRKPQPEMLRQAARDLSLDLSVSYMIGDSPSDIAAGEAAGCRRCYLIDANVAGSLSEAVQDALGENRLVSR